MVEGTTPTRFVVTGKQYVFDYMQSWSDNFKNLVPKTSRLPGVHGGIDEYGSQPAPAEIGNVGVNFGIYNTAKSDATAKFDALNALSRWEKGRLYMQPADTLLDERWCWARINNIAMTHNFNKHTDLMMRVQVDFQVSDPHWYSQGTYPWLWGDGTNWGSKKWGGAAVPVAVSGLQNDITVTRIGNAPVKAVIKFVCGVGQTAEDVTIQRIKDAVVLDEMKFTGVLVAGDSLVLNAFEASVRKNSIDAYTTAFTTKYADWFTLMPNANTVRVKLKNVGDAGSVTIQYYEAYV